jgi:hypothetical protein
MVSCSQSRGVIMLTIHRPSLIRRAWPQKTQTGDEVSGVGGIGRVVAGLGVRDQFADLVTDDGAVGLAARCGVAI